MSGRLQISQTSPTIILLAEDDPDDAFLARQALLKSGFPHQLVHVPDGEAAINYLSGQSPFTDRSRHPLPNLILLDIKMPRASGLEVLEWLTTQPQLASIPVIVLTGSVSPEDRLKAQALGIAGYEAKPLGLPALQRLAASFVPKNPPR
jgi:CheY-like chemotaxis protein